MMTRTLRSTARRQRGSTMVEAAMMVPVLILLFLGMVEFARVGFTYYTAQKMLYTFARFVSVQQGTNFCSGDDANITLARNLALFGNPEGSGEALLPNLTRENFEVRIERRDPNNDTLATCACDSTGCDASTGGRSPDFIVARFTEGVTVQLRVPLIPTDPIVLRPIVRLPYGGT